jgi:hypothetical protein
MSDVGLHWTPFHLGAASSGTDAVCESGSCANWIATGGLRSCCDACGDAADGEHHTPTRGTTGDPAGR